MDFYSTKFRNWISFQPHQQYNETETINSNIVHVWYTYNNIGSIIELWMTYLNFLSHAIHHLFCINVLEIRKYIWFNWEWALHSQRPENSLLMLQGSNSCPPDITQRVFTSRLASKQGYIFFVLNENSYRMSVNCNPIFCNSGTQPALSMIPDNNSYMRFFCCWCWACSSRKAQTPYYGVQLSLPALRLLYVLRTVTALKVLVTFSAFYIIWRENATSFRAY
jgi:hypothetical protein